MNYRSILVMLFFSAAFALSNSGYVDAEQTLSGEIQGFNCLVIGAPCPKDNMDPHLMLESDFVLLLGNGDYYLLPNIARDVKAKYFGSLVKVSGKVNDKYRAIMVNSLEVKTGDMYKTVWSVKMMREELIKQIEAIYVEH